MKLAFLLLTFLLAASSVDAFVMGLVSTVACIADQIGVDILNLCNKDDGPQGPTRQEAKKQIEDAKNQCLKTQKEKSAEFTALLKAEVKKLDEQNAQKVKGSQASFDLNAAKKQ